VNILEVSTRDGGRGEGVEGAIYLPIFGLSSGRDIPSQQSLERLFEKQKSDVVLVTSSKKLRRP
jgi:hypothetical protein